MSEETEKNIKIVCKNLEDMLVSKNRAYGKTIRRIAKPALIFS